MGKNIVVVFLLFILLIGSVHAQQRYISAEDPRDFTDDWFTSINDLEGNKEPLEFVAGTNIDITTDGINRQITFETTATIDVNSVDLNCVGCITLENILSNDDFLWIGDASTDKNVILWGNGKDWQEGFLPGAGKLEVYNGSNGSDGDYIIFPGTGNKFEVRVGGLFGSTDFRVTETLTHAVGAGLQSDLNVAVGNVVGRALLFANAANEYIHNSASGILNLFSTGQFNFFTDTDDDAAGTVSMFAVGEGGTTTATANPIFTILKNHQVDINLNQTGVFNVDDGNTSLDFNAFFVNADTDRVGVRTNNPLATFQVGKLQPFLPGLIFDNMIAVGGSSTVKVYLEGSNAASLLMVDLTGVANQRFSRITQQREKLTLDALTDGGAGKHLFMVCSNADGNCTFDGNILMKSDVGIGFNGPILAPLHVQAPADKNVTVIHVEADNSNNGALSIGVGTGVGPFISGNTNPDGSVSVGAGATRLGIGGIGFVVATSDETSGARIWDQRFQITIPGVGIFNGDFNHLGDVNHAKGLSLPTTRINPARSGHMRWREDMNNFEVFNEVSNKWIVFGTESEKSWSFGSPAGSTGIFYFGGFYDFAASDNDFSGGPTFGTANSAHGSHFFVVVGDATVDELTLRVTGTSIDDAAVRTTSDTEDIVIPNSTGVNSYFETDMKWIGQVTITVVSGTAKTMNYGFVKYWDNNNKDFLVTGFEATWVGGANDTGADINLLHHRATGWEFVSGGEPIPPSAISSMSEDYVTERQVFNAEPGAYKRDNLSIAVNGGNGEGIIIAIKTTANKTFETPGNLLVRVRPN